MIMQLAGAQLAKADLPAMVELAHRQLIGEVMPFDQKFVLDTFRRGSEAGIAAAHTGLSNCYSWSVGMDYDCMPVDEKPIRQLLEKAADMGDANGTYLLGKYLIDTCLRHGTHERAMALLDKAVSMGSVDAEAFLAVCILDGNYVEQDTEAGLAKLRVLVEEKSNTLAAVYLGHYHRNTVRDFKTAEKYFLIAAEKNHAGAMVALGDMVLGNKPWEARKDKKLQGADWYRKAIARNSAEAMRKLGGLQVRDTTVRKEGEDWYQLWLDADRKGDSTATFELAEIHNHAPGYFFRDLDWSKSAAFYEKYLVRNPRVDGSSYSAVERLLELYGSGGHGLKRDFRKCLEIALPYIDFNTSAAACVGRILLHAEAPMGKTREHFIRGYACLLKSRELSKYHEQDLYLISDEALFMLRSRHGMTQEEVKQAEALLKKGYPNRKTPILP